MKKDKARSHEIQLVFESVRSNHALKFAKLMQTYLDVNVEYKRLAFFWL